MCLRFCSTSCILIQYSKTCVHSMFHLLHGIPPKAPAIFYSFLKWQQPVLTPAPWDPKQHHEECLQMFVSTLISSRVSQACIGTLCHSIYKPIIWSHFCSPGRIHPSCFYQLCMRFHCRVIWKLLWHNSPGNTVDTTEDKSYGDSCRFHKKENAKRQWL